MLEDRWEPDNKVTLETDPEHEYNRPAFRELTKEAVYLQTHVKDTDLWKICWFLDQTGQHQAVITQDGARRVTNLQLYQLLLTLHKYHQHGLYKELKEGKVVSKKEGKEIRKRWERWAKERKKMGYQGSWLTKKINKAGLHVLIWCACIFCPCKVLPDRWG